MTTEAAGVIATLAADLAPKARRILELQCGDGSLAARLLKLIPGATWKGYESDPDLAERAAARLEFMGSGVSLVQEDFRSASLGNGFDLAVSASGLLGLSPEEKERILVHVHHALLPGGALLFADAVRPPSAGIAAAYRLLEREELRAQGLSREAVEREIKEEVERKGLWSVEEELYRLRKAAFREVDLAWKCWDRAVFAGLK